MTIANKTTAIGSLPHHNVDAALACSFQTSIPFLPQIPIRNPWEYMIPQALEGLPGLQISDDGSAELDVYTWLKGARTLDDRLHQAFSKMDDIKAFESFEPSSPTSSSWQPFVWELGERKIKLAKVQIAGPLTCQWVLRYKPTQAEAPELLDLEPKINMQIFRLVLARALAMSLRLQSIGVKPLLFLDEPGLFGLSTAHPKHLLGLQELKIVIQTLRKQKVLVGLHCCSNTDWSSLFKLDLDYLSIDVNLSLSSILDHPEEVCTFVGKGGRFSLGLIPTQLESRDYEEFNLKGAYNRVEDLVISKLPGAPHVQALILKESLITPACGLALQSVPNSEAVLGLLS